MNAISILLAFACLILTYLAWQARQKQQQQQQQQKKNKRKLINVPKGPFSYPIVGNLLQLGDRPYETLWKWSRENYGPIFRIYLGSQEVIVLNGADLIRDALIKHGEEFAGRPKLYMTHVTLKEKGLITSPYNQDHFEHRKFLISKINSFGRRRSSLETNCLQTIRETLDEYRERIDHNFEYTNTNMKNSLSQITSQNVLTMTFGTRMYDKKNFSTLMDLITENFTNAGVSAAFNFIPCARVFKKFIFKNVMRCSDFLNTLISEKMSEYHEDIDVSYFSDYISNLNYQQNNNKEEDTNIIECYLKELMNNACFFNESSYFENCFDKGLNLQNATKKRSSTDDDGCDINEHDDDVMESKIFKLQSKRLLEKRHSSLSLEKRRKSTTTTSSSKFKSFSFDHLSSLVQDLFIAGTETTSASLSWSIIYAANYTECQNEIANEIHRVLGREKLPTESDRYKLPYVEAFLNETMRMHCAGPILLPRSVTHDTQFRGCHLPQDTFVLANMWSCMRDPAYWIEPDKFDPKRFLDEQTGQFKREKNPAMMPFGAGKRACIGESIARSQLFLIFTSLMQKFELSFANLNDMNNEKLLAGIPGMGLNPPNVALKLKLR
jgi:cytochrome P450